MRFLFILLSFFFIEICYADVTCYLNLVKDSCWNNFDVNISVIDMSDRKQISQAAVAKKVKWKRISFSCNPGQTLYYNASFSPVFWKSDEGKVYDAIQYWSLPSKLKPGDVAWELTICFPKDFSGVPLPPTAGSDCACQYDQVTPLNLNKKE